MRKVFEGCWGWWVSQGMSKFPPCYEWASCAGDKECGGWGEVDVSRGAWSGCDSSPGRGKAVDAGLCERCEATSREILGG